MNQKIIQIKFVGHEIQRGVVMYKIQLYDIRDSTQWEMLQRYSKMRVIHNKLKLEHPDKIPQFPPKKWFGNTDEKFINQREKSLENYFSNCLKSINIDKSQTLRDFLLKNKQQTGLFIIDPSPRSNSLISPTTQNKSEIKPVINHQQIFNDKMVKIVQNVPFIDFVPFVSPEHNNQDYKRNVYNQITFERKSKLLQNLQLPSCTTDYSQQAKQASPVNAQFGKKMDIFADKLNKSLNSQPTNIRCDFVTKANLA